ncbi:MAG: hypothetical protein PHG05_03795 [Candidatus Nanoarchaeia archaeon]|nr:hypothetical protein [Candidatus Nanoarchaeia archaeon]
MAGDSPSKKDKEKPLIIRLLKKEKEEDVKKVEGEALLGECLKQFYVIIEDPAKGVEPIYFWYLNFLRDLLKHNVEKISDVFTATEASSFFGDLSARRSQLQEKVSNYMGLIATMSKSIFQIIREVRIIKERLSYYEDAKKYHSADPKEKEAGDAAEIALKSIWVDMVEGGIQNASSVYGIATKVGFYTLPDFFFRIHAKDKDDVGKAIKNIEGINQKLKEVLSRKLYQYYVWKEKTYAELKTREKFTLKYLSQQYDAMRLYTSWIKPYLKAINKLDLTGKAFSFTDPDLVTAFDTSKIKLEIIGTLKKFNMEGIYDKIEMNHKHFIQVVRVEFEFSSIPHMAFQQNYQRGAVHGGVTRVWVKAYAPKMEEYEEYIKKRENEDFEILKSIDSTLDSLGEELKNYLKEAENVFAVEKDAKEKESKDKKAKENEEIGPFKALKLSFKDLGSSFGQIIPKQNKEDKRTEYEKDTEKSAAESGAIKNSFFLYDYFKKNFGLLSW